MEFPVIDGVPLIVADPPGLLRNAAPHVLARADLPASLTGLLGDALGPGCDFDTTRQHLSIYCDAHFSDWTGGDVPDLVSALRQGLGPLGQVQGPAIDLGGAVGRGGWELARSVAPVLVADLNIAFLRLAQRLALEGEASFDRRRVGLVYDRVRIALPDDAPAARLDFWAVDAMALPFRSGTFGLATAMNLVDSVAGPTEAVSRGRARPGAGRRRGLCDAARLVGQCVGARPLDGRALAARAARRRRRARADGDAAAAWARARCRAARPALDAAPA